MNLKDSNDIGAIIRAQRKRQGLTQFDLAASAGVGTRFIVDLERGKPTCQLDKALKVMQMLGIRLTVRGGLPDD